ncbi:MULTISPECIES: exonuclease domain-containing protein [unclassified Kitasatospora]|uniref:exonuclease domain-containing protein n=1 Tax=unclassified Kitasatospora TaxID=2633591 RepID=UPI0024755F7E|nr:exonuclease domain-containing protein [Kitasatospora sp. MAP12-44]
MALDFETANENRGSVCAVGMVTVQDGQVIDRWETFIQPPESISGFSPFNTSIHGITAGDVKNAPTWRATLPEIVGRAAGRVVVAHNAAFDLGALRDACDADGTAWPELRYACSLVTARRAWPERLSYKLGYLVEDLGLDLNTDRHHTALWDAEMSARVMLAAMDRHDAPLLHDLLGALNVGYGHVRPDGQWTGSVFKSPYVSGSKTPLPETNPDADPNGALYGMTVFLTGTLSSMTRIEAQQRIAHAGGFPGAKGLSKQTNILVVGDLRSTEMLDGRPNSSKVKAAAKYRAAGQDIEMLDEAEFLARLAS